MTDPLNGQIEALVDTLRGRPDAALSLSEVASVTEVLIKTMKLYFRSVDVKIYEECQNLGEYITNARKEIASLQPESRNGARIPRAGKELEAIVRQTEEATDTIMEASEKIMSLEADSLEAYQAAVNDEIMKIFEACSFQDITGQRISKVVETLSYIEHRSNKLKNILGIDLDASADEDDHDDDMPGDSRSDAHLLNGPALEGEGIDQSAVDELMDGFDSVEPASDAPVSAEDVASAEATEPEPVEAAEDADDAEGDPETDPETTSETDPDTDTGEKDGSAKSNGRTTQDEIDALFN